jgi:hypothetical protein
MLPFFLDYYRNFVGVERFFLFDDGSTDQTKQLIRDYPVELIDHPSQHLDDRDLLRIKSDAYKQWRHLCDWFIVCDIDEFLYHPALSQLLARYRAQGVTVPLVEGYEMYSKEFPRFRPSAFLPKLIQQGIPNPLFYNKFLIFNPQVDINYDIGCHTAEPAGPVRFSERFELKNLHYKHLSFDYVTARSRALAARRSAWNLATGAAIHHEENAKRSLFDYLANFGALDNVLEPVGSALEGDTLMSFVVSHLLTINQNPVMLEMADAAGFPSALERSFALLERKIGMQRIRLRHPKTSDDLVWLAHLATLDASCHCVCIDASLIQAARHPRESFDAFLTTLIGLAGAGSLLVMLDLASCSGLQREDLLASACLQRHFEHWRFEAVILARYKQQR